MVPEATCSSSAWENLGQSHPPQTSVLGRWRLFVNDWIDDKFFDCFLNSFSVGSEDTRITHSFRSSSVPTTPTQNKQAAWLRSVGLQQSSCVLGEYRTDYFFLEIASRLLCYSRRQWLLRHFFCLGFEAKLSEIFHKARSFCRWNAIWLSVLSNRQ